MQNYTTLEIQSITILILFLFYFVWKIKILLRRFKNKSLLKKNRTLKKLKRLSWDDFEVLCMQLFSKMGWSVQGNAKKGADGGVDIWMHKRSFTKKNIRAIVQCKRYDDALVTINVIREMYGLMHEYSVNEVYVVTTSRFTKECHSFVKGKNMELVDGKRLLKYIDKYT